MILYMYIHVALGQGLTTPRGQNFCQQEHLVTHLLQVLKKNLFEVWFYAIFFQDFIHVYSPGAGADSPHGTKF